MLYKLLFFTSVKGSCTYLKLSAKFLYCDGTYSVGFGGSGSGFELPLFESLPPQPASNNVVVKPHYDTIVRVRRITGYLSTLPRFNDAKKKEAADRVSHIQ